MRYLIFMFSVISGILLMNYAVILMSIMITAYSKREFNDYSRVRNSTIFVDNTGKFVIVTSTINNSMNFVTQITGGPIPDKEMIVDMPTLNTELNPVTPSSSDWINPVLLHHQSFSYPEFVLPSPIRIPSMSYPKLSSISTYYKTLMDTKLGCSKRICTHPVEFVTPSDGIDCLKTPTMCSNYSEVLIMHESKYVAGSVHVILNGRVSRYLDCGWPANHMDSVKPFLKYDANYIKGTVVYLTVPEGLSFQHFIDGVVPKLVQLYDFIKSEKDLILIMDMQFCSDMPKQMLRRIGIQEKQIGNYDAIPFTNGYIYADKLILGCQVPPLHPLLWKKAQELFKLPWLQSGWKQRQKVVAYLSRKKGTLNGRREVINENELLDQIRPVVEENGYQFVLFDKSEYPLLENVLNFFADVDVIMGPHGGAFYNMLFMRRHSVVIEFMPQSYEFLSTGNAVHLIVYLQAVMLDNRYFNVLGPLVGIDNMMVNQTTVIDILKLVL